MSYRSYILLIRDVFKISTRSVTVHGYMDGIGPTSTEGQSREFHCVVLKIVMSYRIKKNLNKTLTLNVKFHSIVSYTFNSKTHRLGNRAKRVLFP